LHLVWENIYIYVRIQKFKAQNARSRYRATTVRRHLIPFLESRFQSLDLSLQNFPFPHSSSVFPTFSYLIILIAALPKKRKRKVANLKYFFARIIYLCCPPINTINSHQIASLPISRSHGLSSPSKITSYPIIRTESQPVSQLFSWPASREPEVATISWQAPPRAKPSGGPEGGGWGFYSPCDC